MAAHNPLQKTLLLQAILARRDITSTDKVIAARLLNHLNSVTGMCIPSYDTLAEGAGVSHRTAIESVKHLKNRKIITKARRFTDGDAGAR